MMQVLVIAAVLFLSGSPVMAQQPVYSLNDDLFYRINFGRVEDVKLLLDKGVNPNAVSNTGEYALTVAIGRNDSEATLIAKLLLDRGANPNVHDKTNPYPIITAATNNQTDIVAYLLDKGADYHVKSATGKSLIDIATKNNNTTIIKLVQDRLEKDAQTAASLRSPERYKQLVHQYVYDSCIYQYWDFVIGSRQEPDKEEQMNVWVEQSKTDISELIEQIRLYFPTTPTADLQGISEQATQKIFNALDSMISNRNRAAHGVGKQEDASERCHKISDSIEIAFPGSSTSPAGQ